MNCYNYMYVICTCRIYHVKYCWYQTYDGFEFSWIFCFLPSGSSSEPDEKKYTIYIASTPGHFTVLTGSMTLEQVNEKYWKVNKPLEMYFAVQKREEK